MEKMDLSDTVDLMNSFDYKQRFKAEYWQTKMRYENLHDIIVKLEAGTLPYKVPGKRSVLEAQQRAMYEYLYALEIRAETEHINLYNLSPTPERK